MKYKYIKKAKFGAPFTPIQKDQGNPISKFMQTHDFHMVPFV